jgi:hypothetical protein
VLTDDLDVPRMKPAHFVPTQRPRTAVGASSAMLWSISIFFPPLRRAH